MEKKGFDAKVEERRMDDESGDEEDDEMVWVIPDESDSESKSVSWSVLYCRTVQH